MCVNAGVKYQKDDVLSQLGELLTPIYINKVTFGMKDTQRDKRVASSSKFSIIAKLHQLREDVNYMKSYV